MLEGENNKCLSPPSLLGKGAGGLGLFSKLRCSLKVRSLICFLSLNHLQTPPGIESRRINVKANFLQQFG
ncbi:hypothetical protein Oscil6304_2454 [Oscillatoria acuminata PCC 6304]|uniref:Uncharacterized protein n=1 Tax=Oscillatoria acuminata PCC 6304 TaxID=56110 RepID=K9TIT6_9CYAN|nr:hypothetical protein Oscil6304_2454 [Oscillatoria acuminata PCC 6304]